jgi:hypothetical protein
MRFVEIPRVKRSLLRLNAEGKLRYSRGDSPSGGFFNDLSPKVKSFLIEKEREDRYPRAFSRSELLCQAAQYLSWACSLAETRFTTLAQEEKKLEIGEFGWNSYLVSFWDALTGIVNFAGWISIEEADNIARTAPALHRWSKLRDELLWIGGDRLVVQVALAGRALELLVRTNLFREPSTAKRELQKLFQQESSPSKQMEVSIVRKTSELQMVENPALRPAPIHERIPGSNLASVPWSTLALLVFARATGALDSFQKKTYVNCAVFISPKVDAADSKILEHFYRIFALLDIPPNERQNTLDMLMRADSGHGEVRVPQFADPMVHLSLFTDLLTLASGSLGPEKIRLMKEYSDVLRLFGSSEISPLEGLKQFLMDDKAREFGRVISQVSEVLPAGKMKSLFKIGAITVEELHGHLNRTDHVSQDAKFDLLSMKSNFRTFLAAAIENALCHIPDADEPILIESLRKLRIRYEQSVTNDLDYFKGARGWEWPSNAQRRLKLISRLESLRSHHPLISENS